MIAIIDYDIGNIGSIQNVFSFLGEDLVVESDPKKIQYYNALILPGVGAFDTAMQSLQEKDFIEPLNEFVKSGKSLLGICLGMQLLCKGSEEGILAGLGYVDGMVRSLKNVNCNGKIPHVGFNDVKVESKQKSFLDKSNGKDFYFVHSYALTSLDGNERHNSLAYTEYEGVTFISAFQAKNIFASQFHPEKSGEAGVQLLSEFIKCSKNV